MELWPDRSRGVLAGLIGGLLITRGLAAWLPILEGVLGTLLVIVLAGIGIAYQGGFFARRKAAKQATPTPPKPPAPTASK
jgi:hypothetical protein